MDMSLMVKELRNDEGVRYVMYYDTMKIPTTGVGHNLNAAPLQAGWTYPLSDDQVNQLLMSDIQGKFTDLDQHLPWWRALDEVRQRVMTNMCFNMGINTLLTFHNTLASIQNGNYPAAAAGMKASQWYVQVGARAVRLCSAMQNGVMPA